MSGSPLARLRHFRLRKLALRARITLAFSFGALVLSALLAATTFALTRANLISQRESAVLSRVYVNAGLVRSGLDGRTNEQIQTTLLPSLQLPENSRPLVHFGQRWFSITAAVGEDSIPLTLRSLVTDGGKPARMTFTFASHTSLAVGVPLPSVQAEYYEIVDLSDLESTLESLGISLLGASLITTLAGVGVGAWASRRALRPLSDVSQAAEAIAGGRLDTRLEATSDPDLGVLASSFNHMAGALEERIERDARFASDVSHELRSPLMTLSTSVDIIEARRDELPERAQSALDLLSAEVTRFNQLVEDLLEISRYDAGAVRLELDELRLSEFVMQAVAVASNATSVPVEIDPELAGVVVQADKRRLVRVLANLLDNARKYGEGATSVAVTLVDDTVQLAVEDDGPGVPPEERALIFDRFARGGEAGRRGAGLGVGLGLALVAEHVRLHGGRVWVEDRRDGKPGARFVVELPAVRP